MKEINFEVYTKNPITGECGWDIKFVSVIAEDKEKAREVLKTWSLFDVVILHNYSVELPDTLFESGNYLLSNGLSVNEGEIFDTDCYVNPNQQYILIVK